MTGWRVRGTVVRVIDGDTVVLDLDLGWRVWYRDEPCRLHGIDAPELRTDAGKVARDFLTRLLTPGTRLWVEGVERDKYGRVLARLTIDDDHAVDVNALMLSTGHARLYSGGPR